MGGGLCSHNVHDRQAIYASNDDGDAHAHRHNRVGHEVNRDGRVRYGAWLGGIPPSSSLCGLCQLPNRDWIKTAFAGEQAIKAIERIPTRLWAKVSGKLEATKVNVEARRKRRKQVGGIITVHAHILANASRRSDARRRNAGLLCHQNNHFL